MIGRLGLRYHPANQADLAQHQAMLALLAEDLASVPPELLQRAIDRHVATSPYMPRAADLIKLARETPGETLTENALHEWCAERNAWAARIGADWWYRVEEINRGGEPVKAVTKLEGWKARDAREFASGNFKPAWKPEPGEMAAIHRYVAGFVAQGMSQAEFNQLVDEGRI